MAIWCLSVRNEAGCLPEITYGMALARLPVPVQQKPQVDGTIPGSRTAKEASMQVFASLHERGSRRFGFLRCGPAFAKDGYS